MPKTQKEKELDYSGEEKILTRKVKKLKVQVQGQVQSDKKFF
jgi:hypothetical protein